MWQLLFLFCLSVNLAFGADDDCIIYDKFTAEPVTDEALAYFESAGITSTCTMKVKTCNESEGRRTDGSCNSLDKPSMGTFLVPQERVLPAYYNESRSRNMTASRRVRYTLLWEGKSISLKFTQAVPTYGIWSFGDVGSTHDITYFLVNKTDCCEAEHMNDEMCTPNIVTEDDPVHRLTNIRCLNLTKPLDHQFLGCTNDSTPSPIAQSTGVMDLSQIYNAANKGDHAIRLYEGGLLKTETDEYGVVWPPSGGTTNISCIGNTGSDETRCWTNYPSALLGGVMITVWLIRNHNFYATQLAAVNPHWDDDKLFAKAKDLNIANYLHILYDEWLVTLTGEDYLIEKGLKLQDNSRVDRYDSTKPPHATLEFIYILRWFHLVQEPIANKYDSEGNVVGGFPQTQLMFRPGFAAKENNLPKYTPGLYRQPCAAFDQGVDPDMTTTGMPRHLQRSVDIITSDLHKGITLGMSPYIQYVYYCTGVNITCWDDLRQFISDEHIELLKLVYDSVEEIELLAGAWVEKHLKGGSIAPTVACLVVDYLKKNIISDRHWYERPNRVNALSDGELEQLKCSTLATLICTNGDGVTEIQKEAFKVISDSNPLVSCDDIPQIDFQVFADAA